MRRRDFVHCAGGAALAAPFGRGEATMAIDPLFPQVSGPRVISEERTFQLHCGASGSVRYCRSAKIACIWRLLTGRGCV